MILNKKSSLNLDSVLKAEGAMAVWKWDADLLQVRIFNAKFLSNFRVKLNLRTIEWCNISQKSFRSVPLVMVMHIWA
jgi:hypothetical protein